MLGKTPDITMFQMLKGFEKIAVWTFDLRPTDVFHKSNVFHLLVSDGMALKPLTIGNFCGNVSCKHVSRYTDTHALNRSAQNLQLN